MDCKINELEGAGSKTCEALKKHGIETALEMAAKWDSEYALNVWLRTSPRDTEFRTLGKYVRIAWRDAKKRTSVEVKLEISTKVDRIKSPATPNALPEPQAPLDAVTEYLVNMPTKHVHKHDKHKFRLALIDLFSHNGEQVAPLSIDSPYNSIASLSRNHQENAKSIRILYFDSKAQDPSYVCLTKAFDTVVHPSRVIYDMKDYHVWHRQSSMFREGCEMARAHLKLNKKSEFVVYLAVFRCWFRDTAYYLHYIGKADMMEERWRRHCSDANRVMRNDFIVRGKTEKTWTPQLVDTVLAACTASVDAVVFIIDQCKDEKETYRRESELIAKYKCYKGLGASVGLNMTS